jgi:uncharacterized protein (DUF2147 family)
MMTLFRISCLALAVTIAAAWQPARAASPNGVWTMGKVTVRVQNCGANLCAVIVGLAEPVSKIDGKPKVDRKNPNAAKRKRPIIGLSILIGMRPAGAGKWKGSIYNPDDGRTYSASVSFAGNRLKVTGCVAGILCKAKNLVRVR